VVDLPAPPKPANAGADEPSGGWVDLLTLPWESAAAGWTPNNDGLPRRNRDVTNQPLRSGGRRYASGIGTHAPSEISYHLAGRYARFTCAVGAAERGGSVVFEVYGDSRKLFDSGTLHGLGEVHRLDVSVQGVEKLRLIVTDAGDGYIHDMANWVNPRLLRAE
jgi:alpha-galactosidase